MIDEAREKVCFTLPWPPSVNHYYRAAGRGKRVLTDRAKAFRSEVLAWVRAAGANRAFGEERLRMRITVRPPNRARRDLDNLLKAVQDALAHAGVFRDDEQIDALTIIRGDVVALGCLHVELQAVEEV